MTRKDFILIADALVASYPVASYPGEVYPVEVRQWWGTVYILAIHLRRSCPRFNREKWLSYITDQLS